MCKGSKQDVRISEGLQVNVLPLIGVLGWLPMQLQQVGVQHKREGPALQHGSGDSIVGAHVVHAASVAALQLMDIQLVT